MNKSHGQVVSRLPSVHRLKTILLVLTVTFLLSISNVYGKKQVKSNKAPTTQLNIYYEKHTQNSLNFIHQLAQQIRQKLPNYQVNMTDIELIPVNEIKKQIPEESNCTVTLGLKATQKVLSMRASAKIFSLHLPRLQLDKLHRVYKELGVFITGIYQEQTFHRQINLSRAINPKIDSISILLNQADKFDLPYYRQIAQASGLKLNYKILQFNDTADKHLTSISAENGFLLVSNNPFLYHKTKLASLILSAYHNQINLIGSQQEDTVVGTLASVYTPQKYLAQQASDEIKQLCQQQRQILPHYANQFAVKVNQQIALNLNSQLAGDSLQQVNQQLTRQLLEMEKQPHNQGNKQ